jgi:hypothetical protein
MFPSESVNPMPAEKLNLQQLAEQLEFLVEQGRSEDVRLLIADERPEDVAEALLGWMPKPPVNWYKTSMMTTGTSC